MSSQTVRIGEHEFDHATYDGDADVLYLRNGESGTTATTYGTPEGHAVRLNSEGRVVGMTLVNARWLLERDGHIRVTVPTVAQAQAAEFADLLSAGA